MKYRCKECESDGIGASKITPSETEYVCQNCGNRSCYIENVAYIPQNYLGEEIKFKNLGGEIGEGKVIGILSDKDCFVVEIDGLYKKDRIGGWSGECLNEENVLYLKDYTVREDKGYYYIKIYEILEGK